MDINLIDWPGLGLVHAILAQPLPLQAWIGWLVFINLVAPLPFIHHREAQATILIFVVNAVAMSVLFEAFGWSKILGLSHLVLWPPLLIWIADRWYGIESSAMRIWILLLIGSNGVSLALDSYDAALYFGVIRAG